LSAAKASGDRESTEETTVNGLLAVHPLMDEGLYGGPTDELCSAVDHLMLMLGSEDIADVVADAVAAGRTSLDHAEIYLGVATWSGIEKGASMQHTLDSWLRDGDDVIRIHLALHSEYYPLGGAAEMVAVLTDVAERFPQFQQRCAELIACRPR
jgi:hypothetical protein